MSDLWTTASTDHEKVAHDGKVAAARAEHVESFAFCASAKTKSDFENRLALVADRIDAPVRADVVEGWRFDFDALQVARTADLDKVAAPGVCPKCGSESVIMRGGPLGGPMNPMGKNTGTDSECKSCGNKWHTEPKSTEPRSTSASRLPFVHEAESTMGPTAYIDSEDDRGNVLVKTNVPTILKGVLPWDFKSDSMEDDWYLVGYNRTRGEVEDAIKRFKTRFASKVGYANPDGTPSDREKNAPCVVCGGPVEHPEPNWGDLQVCDKDKDNLPAATHPKSVEYTKRMNEAKQGSRLPFAREAATDQYGNVIRSSTDEVPISDNLNIAYGKPGGLNVEGVGYISPWAVREGDLMIGMPGRKIIGYTYGGTGSMGSDAERQRWLVHLDDGKVIPYNGDSKVHVKRDLGKTAAFEVSDEKKQKAYQDQQAAMEERKKQVDQQYLDNYNRDKVDDPDYAEEMWGHRLREKGIHPEGSIVTYAEFPPKKDDEQKPPEQAPAAPAQAPPAMADWQQKGEPDFGGEGLTYWGFYAEIDGIALEIGSPTAEDDGQWKWFVGPADKPGTAYAQGDASNVEEAKNAAQAAAQQAKAAPPDQGAQEPTGAPPAPAQTSQPGQEQQAPPPADKPAEKPPAEGEQKPPDHKPEEEKKPDPNCPPQKQANYYEDQGQAPQEQVEEEPEPEPEPAPAPETGAPQQDGGGGGGGVDLGDIGSLVTKVLPMLIAQRAKKSALIHVPAAKAFDVRGFVGPHAANVSQRGDDVIVSVPSKWLPQAITALSERYENVSLDGNMFTASERAALRHLGSAIKAGAMPMNDPAMGVSPSVSTTPKTTKPRNGQSPPATITSPGQPSMGAPAPPQPATGVDPMSAQPPEPVTGV